MAGDSVVLDEVRKGFGAVRAVDGLSLRVPAGCIYGLLGPNGAGKTTILRMIMDILRPDSGRIEVLGAPSAGLAKHRVGYMPEEKGLYRKMTVGGTLRYFGAIKGLAAHDLAARVPRWLQRIGLDAWAGRKVEELSRGMHQKLQFAVTCISDPELLILDEPFSGLDPVNVDLLKGIVLGLRGEGKTVIFSTHAMHEAEELCDFLVLINRGRVVFDGTLETIRSGWPVGAVQARLVGETAFLEGLPMVKGVTRAGAKVEIALADGADPQELLAALVGRLRVEAFEVKVPSLHEIFVRLVGEAPSEGSARDPRFL